MDDAFHSPSAARSARHAYSAALESHVRSFVERRHSDLWRSQRRFDLLGPVGPRCASPLEKFGNRDDEKRACGLSKHLSQPCVIVSVGNNNMWHFEADAANRTGCDVHVFDCTVSASTQPPLELRRRVFFHHLCIANRTFDDAAGRSFVTWSTLLQRTVPSAAAPEYLKLDVEGFEYGVMRDVLDSGTLPKQIAIEVHWRTYTSAARASGWPWRCVGGEASARARDGMYACDVPPEAIAQWSDELWRRGRYMLIDRHDNVRSKYCAEVLFARLVG